mgnify:CR=1 FL=1
MSPLLNAVGEWAELLDSDLATEFVSLKGRNLLPSHFLQKRKIDFFNRNPNEFQLEYRLTKLFSKWEDKTEGDRPDTRAAAVTKWLDDNNRLTSWNQRLFRSTDPEFHDFHQGIQDRVTELCKQFCLSAVARYFRHGPGRTSTRAGVRATKVQKYVGPFSISSRMLRYLLSNLTEEDDWWLYHVIRSDQICISDVLIMDTVPKTALIDRVVTYEADLDMYVQLGFHGWLCTHVLPVLGIYIDSSSLPYDTYGPKEGSGVTTKVARHGTSAELHKKYTYYYDTKASLDAESGSNNWTSVYIQYYTEDLKPLQQFLMACEVQHVELPEPWKKNVRKHIHAGMGNGVAFALETLLFHLAMEQVVGVESWISTYGDDMLCWRQHAPRIVEVLSEFTPIRFNVDKSHYLPGDYFVESCGEDTYRGLSVWSLRIKRDPTRGLSFTQAQLRILDTKTNNIHELDKLLSKLQKSKDKLSQRQLELIYDLYTIINGIDRMSVWCLTHDTTWESLSRRILSILPRCLRYLHTPSGNGGRARRSRFTQTLENNLEGWRGVCISIYSPEDTFSHKEDDTSTSVSIGTKRGKKSVSVDGDQLLAYAVAGNPSRSATRLSRNFYRIGLSE